MFSPSARHEDPEEPMITEDNDVAKFDGKIVYNPDGSAYIIEDDNDDVLLPKHDGSIIDRPGASPAEEYPPIANAIYVSRGTTAHNHPYNSSLVSSNKNDEFSEPTPSSASSSSHHPVVHSYRVYSARGDDSEYSHPISSSQPKVPLDLLSVPVKPILMCFICKLSFGCSRSFANHSVSDHNIQLIQEEKSILESKNSSAIIQTTGKNKEALVSFLEPVNPEKSSSSSSSTGAISSSSKVPNENENSMRPPSVKSHSEMEASPLARRTPDSERSAVTPNEMAAAMMAAAAAAAASRKSPSGSVSPAMTVPSSLSSPSPVSFPTNANMLQGTTIGACPDHVNGRPTGVECAKCDLILNASRMPGGIAWNTSRNSCKTLKCPKCNWHYKYQETLEIHMKEKHPDNETTCIYCITGQQHPRLARGETYTCGYKPYRCEVCNYSTTTKGNLSIHMQSDKHLNNMQELQNGGAASVSNNNNPPSSTPDNNNLSGPNSPKINPPLSSPSVVSSSSPQAAAPSPKPNWRCDICNYETNVARNLRIHMTSEKHTHNMLALQQNAKSISALQQMAAATTTTTASGMSSGTDHKQQLLQGFLAAAAASSSASAPDASAAMADLAYNQALLTQLLQQQTLGLLPESDLTSTEQPRTEADPNPRYLFSCCVCKDFGSDNLEPLSSHLSADRTKSRENEVSLVIAGNYLCQLCNYKTNLKANFQLHCKTDKHLQRLNHVNHIKEGGPGNEWKLRFLSNVNPVELRCNACDFFTNSPHKLQVHVAGQQHQISAVLFGHLQKSESKYSDSQELQYECILCKFSAKGKHSLLNHVRSMKHLQMEQIHQLQKRAEGNHHQTDIGDIFRVRENNPLDDSNHSNNSDKTDTPSSSCPLCQEKFQGQEALESHAVTVHSVNAEGIARLQSLINGSHWLNSEGKESKEPEDDKMDVDDNDDGRSSEESKGKSEIDAGGFSPHSSDKYLDPNRPFKCEVCRESFTQKSILLVHYNSVSHLNKLKKSMSGSEKNSENPLQQPPSIPTPEKSPTKGSALEALLGNMKKDSDSDEVKPFKCNICKVAYSQGSTLDIHIRSVLHQTKASKLQELILGGQIDLSKPLIEQPDPQQLQEQHKKMITDMLSPKSLNSTGSSNLQSSPNVRSSSSPINQPSPQSSPLAVKQSASSPEENRGDPPPEVIANFVKNFLPGGGDGKAMAAALSNLPDGKKASSPVLKNLLQNYGFDLVMQFNEYHQRKAREEEEQQQEERKKIQEEVAAALKKEEEEEVDEVVEEEEHKDESHGKFSCPVCKKRFSSIWVLKAHSEEIHKDVVPQEVLEQYVEKLKSDQNNSDEDMITDSNSSKDRKISREEVSRPSSERSSTPQQQPQPQQQHQQQPQAPTLLEMQEALQRAMMQQMNPMMMQMAQLQGLNPLATMNLYPPLIPPGLLQGQQNLPSGGMLDPKVLALMAASSSNKTPDDPKHLNPHATFMQMLAQQQQSLGGNNKIAPMAPLEPFGFPPTPPEHHALQSSHKQSSLPNPPPPPPPPPPTSTQESGGKRARTRISDDQLKILRSHFDINNSPTEETLNLMASQTGLPLKVIKHWFRNTLFKERQKNKDSPYNFSNPPSTKLNLEEYEKSGETKITPLKPEEQGEYIQNEIKKENETCELKSELKVRASSPESNISDSNNSRPDIPSDNGNLTLSRLLAAGGSPLPPNLIPNFPAFPTNPGSMPNYLTTLANRMSQEMNSSPRPQSPVQAQQQQQQSSSQNNSSGKRANRTRFTDYQIKVLQEFFENNAYPKDDDLEYLSKLLGLSPRVIVVWFQNARQKARKIYENQPAGNECSPVASNTSSSSASGTVVAMAANTNNHQSDSDSELNSGRFTRTPGLNYQCKKCLLVFQRYYELIRHQKQHCYKEEDAKRSAQAQKAAGQAAAQYAGQHHSEDSNNSNDRSVISPTIDHGGEDLVSKFVGNNPFLNIPPGSPFGLLHQQQQQALHLKEQQEDDEMVEGDSDSLCSTPSSSAKRKLSEDGGELDAEELQHREKRLRTTITQEQLDFLYQKYLVESNPSRKMLEQISGEVGLRKRVVQVWFQNTRARERKGLYVRPNANGNEENFFLKCPFCPSIPPFKLRSAWESHISAHHSDKNPESFIQDFSEKDSPLVVSESIASLIPNSASAYNLQNSMRKYYEDTMKRFMNDIQEKEQSALDLTSSDCEVFSDNNEDRDPNGDASSQSGNKRFRTQMTGLQIKMMKSVFESYKTPTMIECSGLGKEIGLQKRVVQVWFQNARAKEKRAKLQLQQANGGNDADPGPSIPEECSICNYKYGSHYNIQDHIFSKPHLEKLRVALEQGIYEPESPGHVLSQAASTIQNNSSSGGEPLQMLQINNRELLDMASRQNPRMLMQV